MNNIVLTTDSGMCALKKENSIVIPAQLNSSNGKSYCDNGQISNKQILNDMEKGIIYKTSSPLLGDFENTFKEILENGKDVIHLSMSSGISEGSVNSANIIANELNSKYKNQVYVINSLTGATGGTLFYELAYNELISSKLSTEELVNKLNILKNYIQTSFYVPNIDGYKRSGRDKTKSHLKNSVLSATSSIAKMASLKFRVDFNEKGNLYLKKIFKSSQSNGMQKLVMDIVNENNVNQYDQKFVAIGNLYKEKIDMEKIREYLISLNYFNNIVENEIGSVVAAYGCKDLCGISLIKKLR